MDAISPDGRWLYLIHYTSRRTLRYEVRAFDLAHRRLLRRAVVDPREPDEAMRGIAVTRAVSGDGHWAYTLYQRPEGEPFVHALDTARRTAACIDLPQLGRTDLTQLRLAVRGPRLAALGPAGELAVVDRRTRRVSAAPRTAHRAAVPPPPATAADAFPWGGVAAAVAAAGLVAAGRRTRRGRRRAT